MNRKKHKRMVFLTTIPYFLPDFLPDDLIFSRVHVWFQLDSFSRPNCPKSPGGRDLHFVDVVVVVVIVVVAYVQNSIQFGRPFWQSMF